MGVFAAGRHAREAYKLAYTTARGDVLKAFRGADSDLVELRTDQSAFTALARFFRERRRRIRG
jgi:outer membrane protein TolC